MCRSSGRCPKLLLGAASLVQMLTATPPLARAQESPRTPTVHVAQGAPLRVTATMGGQFLTEPVEGRVACPLASVAVDLPREGPLGLGVYASVRRVQQAIPDLINTADVHVPRPGTSAVTEWSAGIRPRRTVAGRSGEVFVGVGAGMVVRRHTVTDSPVAVNAGAELCVEVGAARTLAPRVRAGMLVGLRLATMDGSLGSGGPLVAVQFGFAP